MTWRHLYGGRRDKNERMPIPDTPVHMLHWPWSFAHPVPDISDCKATKVAPYMSVVWEPLHTKAPRPPKVAPYCCYIRTVIFYHFPYVVNRFGRHWKSSVDGLWRKSETGSFIQWDQIETRLSSGSLVELAGGVFEVRGGSVLWKDRAWWMMHRAYSNTDAAKLFDQRRAA